MSNVSKKESGSYIFGMAQSQADIVLSQSYDISRSVPFIQVKNIDGESTYGGSMGNCMFEAFFLDSSTIRIIREYDFQQPMQVKWDAVEFTDATVNTGTITIDALVKNVTIPSVDITKAFSIINIRGNGAFTSDMRELMFEHIITTSTNLRISGIKTDSQITLRWYTIEFSNVSVQQVSTIATGTSLVSPLPISVNPSKAFIVPSFGGKTSEPVMNGRDTKIARLINGGADVEARGDQPYSIDFSAYVVESTNGGIVQRGTLTMSATSDSATLATAVNPDNCLNFISGQMLNFAAPIGTFEEEFSDFGIVATQPASNPNTTVNFNRGERGSQASAVVDWEVVEFSMIAPITVDRTRAILRGVGRGYNRGVY